ncbi:MAG: cytochrome c biogenesis heme-transporting ATPase CcmA [Pseudomonadota bacterium]
MLQTHGLGCERNRRILFEDLSFQVNAGQVLRIEGGNGSGKTTLLRILCGLFTDFEGEVSWDLPAYPLYLGHKPGVKDLLTPMENLAWLARLYGTPVPEAAVREALAIVGLNGYENTPAGSLSEGQRKRVNLARLFLLDSPAWVLDEPFSAIDVAGVERLQQAIAAQAQKGGIVLLTSHQALVVDAEVTTLRLGTT